MSRSKIPIYELAGIGSICHNGTEGSGMAKGIRLYIMELLREYEEITKRTRMEMALDFEITLSNLYQYRNGTGNPTAGTIDKIVEGVAKRCPKALEKVEWRKTDGNKRDESTEGSV